MIILCLWVIFGLDKIEVVEGMHMGNEAYLEIRYPEWAELSADDFDYINAVAVMHRLRRYSTEKLFHGVDVGHLVMSALAGKSDGGADDSQYSMFNDGPDVNEEALIEENPEFEKTFILKYRSLFSESLSPNRFIKAPPWR